MTDAGWSRPDRQLATLRMGPTIADVFLPVPAGREPNPKALLTAVRASGGLAFNLSRSCGTAHHDVGPVDAREP